MKLTALTCNWEEPSSQQFEQFVLKLGASPTPRLPNRCLGERDEIVGGVYRDLGRLAACLKQRFEPRRASGLSVDEDLLHADGVSRGLRLLEPVWHGDQQAGAGVAELALVASRIAPARG